MNGHLDIGQVSGQASLASAATSMTLFGLSVSEVGVIVSAAVAVVTCIVHVWYTVRKDRREREAAARAVQSDGKEDDVA